MADYKVTTVTPPTEDPVSVAELEAFLRLGSDEDNRFLLETIAAATNLAQAYTNRAFHTQTLRLDLPAFRDPFRFHDPYMHLRSDDVIELPRPPVQSVSSITYKDLWGTETTLSADNYVVVDGKIYPTIGVPWPTPLYAPSSVKITYVAGYGDPEDESVPEEIKQGIMQIAKNLYERTDSSPLSSGARSLLDPYRVRR